MSRFAHTAGGPLHTWNPPESPLKIEYSPALLREVFMANAGIDAFGVLYGVRHDRTVRLVATRGQAGLDLVGVYASRVRGKVFITEEDLERFDKVGASVALVMAGEKGGFFVRDSAGAIETVRSYEEFSLYGEPIPRPIATRKKTKWQWAACLALIPLFYLVAGPPKSKLAIGFRDSHGQLRISWNVPVESTLTIVDGNAKTSIAVSSRQAALVYARRTGNVTIAIGGVQAYFAGSPPPRSEIVQLHASIDDLESKIASLRAVQNAGHTKIAALRRRLQ